LYLEAPNDLRVLGLVAQIKLFKYFQLYSVVVSARSFGFIAAYHRYDGGSHAA
jgi:hypothetical protein